MAYARRPEGSPDHTGGQFAPQVRPPASGPLTVDRPDLLTADEFAAILPECGAFEYDYGWPDADRVFHKITSVDVLCVWDDKIATHAAAQIIVRLPDGPWHTLSDRVSRYLHQGNRQGDPLVGAAWLGARLGDQSDWDAFARRRDGHHTKAFAVCPDCGDREAGPTGPCGDCMAAGG